MTSGAKRGLRVFLPRVHYRQLGLSARGPMGQTFERAQSEDHPPLYGTQDLCVLLGGRLPWSLRTFLRLWLLLLLRCSCVP